MRPQCFFHIVFWNLYLPLPVLVHFPHYDQSNHLIKSFLPRNTYPQCTAWGVHNTCSGHKFALCPPSQQLSLLGHFIDWGISAEINTYGWRFFFHQHFASYWASQVAQWSRIRLPRQEMWVWSWVGKTPLEEKMTTHASILAGGAWQPTVHGVAQSRMWLSARIVGYYIQRLPPDTPVKSSHFCETLSSVRSAVEAKEHSFFLLV